MPLEFFLNGGVPTVNSALEHELDELVPVWLGVGLSQKKLQVQIIQIATYFTEFHFMTPVKQF